MPYKIIYSENPNGVTTFFSGVLTDKEIIQSCEERTSSEEKMRNFQFIKDDLLDVTEFRVTPEAIKICASYALKVSELNIKIVHTAIVPTDLIYGMTRMWDVYSDGTDWNKNIFRNREEAEIWIKDNINEI